MVSTSSAQQTNANALIVSNNPLIISSSASSHLTPTSNVLTSIAAHNTMTQSVNQQSFLQLLQNQQRPFIYSHPQITPQMFLTGHNQLLAPKTSDGTNSSPQTVFIDPNLLAQQQIRTKPIIIPGQHTANLDSRSHILSGLQTNGMNGFLASPITWPPNQPIFVPPQQSAQRLYFHTPVSNQTAALQTPILVPQQNGTLLVSAPPKKQTNVTSEMRTPNKPTASTVKDSTKKTTKKQAKETANESSPNGSSVKRLSGESKSSNITANELMKTIKKDRRKVLTRRNELGEKMIEINEQTKQEKLNRQIHKSTQQMNDELLLKKERFDAIDVAVKIWKMKKNAGKQEKKRNISIVKPRVLLTHNVSGYLIHESNKPFQVESKIDEDSVTKDEQSADGSVMNVTKVEEVPSVKVESPKTKKVKKAKKSKSLNSENSTDLNELSPQIEPTTAITSIQLDLNAEQGVSSKSIYEWSADDVHEFIGGLLNKEIADTLHKEKFDGNSLTLLTIPILRKFDLKLGPILLLIKKIDELKARCKSNQLDNKWRKGNIYEWSVKDTYDFILEVASEENAEEFRKQEIDGYSLTLISEDNLRKDLNISYGPALVIIDKINKLKAKSKQ